MKMIECKACDREKFEKENPLPDVCITMEKDKGGVMKFWEAMKALDEGKKVRCKHWNPEWYLHLGGGVPWNNRFFLMDDGKFWTLELYYCYTAKWEVVE